MDKNIIKIISKVKFWKNEINISPVTGGITNKNFLVNDGNQKFFVRIGNDIPEHLIYRSNEVEASKAASKINICPKLLYHNNSLQIFKFIEGKTFNSNDIKKNLEDITKLIKKVHIKIPNELKGQSVIFWVFHVIKNYSDFLKTHQSSYIKILPELLKKSSNLENVASPFDIVSVSYTHLTLPTTLQV